MPELWIPSGTGHSDFTERKSRFIGESRKVISVDAARKRVKELRLEHPRSSHVAWAYVLGNDAALRGMSDDGEPHGTAGRPIMDPIVGGGLTEILVTVVRYFGGVKLGTGGLTSAYGRCCQDALESMPKVLLVERNRVELRVDYALFEYTARLAGELGGLIVEERFDTTVRLSIDVPVSALEDFRRRILDASRGAAHIETFGASEVNNR